MENQHRQIKGYRELSQAEIDLMNEVKAKGEELRSLVAKIASISIPAPGELDVSTESDHSALIEGTASLSVETEADHPLFWLRYADSSFRCGIMYAVRAIAQPESY